MINNKNCILRLAQYKKALHRLSSLGFNKVFSDNLADAIGVTSSQVRKDFSMFDLSGNKKGGYLIDELIQKLNIILGKNEVEKVILAGFGNIGHALINFKGFDKEGIKITAAFDSDKNKINDNKEIPVYNINEMSDFIKKNNIKLAIVAVPDMTAQTITETMIESGIKGILNFAPIHLKVPDDVYVTNVNLEVELETLIYFVNLSEKTD